MLLLAVDLRVKSNDLQEKSRNMHKVQHQEGKAIGCSTVLQKVKQKNCTGNYQGSVSRLNKSSCTVPVLDLYIGELFFKLQF